MRRLVSSAAGALGGLVVGFLLVWNFEIVSTKAVLLLCLLFVGVGVVSPMLFSEQFLARTYEFILRMLNPP